jgi:P2 family phage major capsid protein
MQHLSKVAQDRMTGLIQLTAEKYGGVVGQQYAATPSIAQDLNDKIIENGNPFLSRINIVPVTEVKGEKVFLGLSGPVTSRTDTTPDGVERKPRELAALDGKLYELFATESDVAMRYAQIDVWAKFKDFAARYGKAFTLQMGNDRLRVGWSGISAAATTNLTTNPLLQDLNIGWLKQIEDFNGGSQILIGTGASGSPTAIELGSTTFPNLAYLIYTAFDKLKEPWRSEPDLIALVSRNILSAAQGQFFKQYGQQPTEKKEITKQLLETFGGLPIEVPPFLPDGFVLITSLNNLSIYWQEESWRRQQVDNPKKNRYEDYNSRNEGYVVEDFNKCFLLKNVIIKP